MPSLNIPKQFEDEHLFTIDGFTATMCCSPESRALAFKLRYNSYIDANTIRPNPEKELNDAKDFLPNSRTHLIWYEGKPVASVRSSIWSAKYHWLTTESVEYFWHQIHKNIGLHKNILESCRFVIDPTFKGRNSLKAQLLMYRIQDLNSQFEKIDDIITNVKENHAKFYKRMLDFDQVSEESIRVEWIDADVVLLKTTPEKARNTIVKKGMPLCSQEEVERYTYLANRIIREFSTAVRA